MQPLVGCGQEQVDALALGEARGLGKGTAEEIGAVDGAEDFKGAAKGADDLRDVFVSCLLALIAFGRVVVLSPDPGRPAHVATYQASRLVV